MRTTTSVETLLSGTQARIGGRRRVIVTSAFAVLALLTSAAPADNGRSRGPNNPTGTIRYPCVHPSFTKPGAMPNGVCGYRFPVSGGGNYVLHPLKPADLDIHFYDALGELIGSNAGSPTQCGDLSHPVPGSAVAAIVVTSPTGCSGRPGGSFQGSEVDVAFKYSS